MHGSILSFMGSFISLFGSFIIDCSIYSIFLNIAKAEHHKLQMIKGIHLKLFEENLFFPFTLSFQILYSTAVRNASV